MDVDSHQMDDPICSTLEYGDGVKEVKIVGRDGIDMSKPNVELVRECLEKDGFVFIKNHPQILSWVEALGKDRPHMEDGHAAFHGLASIFSDLVHESKEFMLRVCYHRLAGSDRSYANHCHRDLDEVSLKNLNLESGRNYNFWVPIVPVRTDPLALLLPETLKPESIAGYKGLEFDHSGLLYDPEHQWVYFKNMEPGSAIIFQTDLIYHAAFELPGQMERTRESVDGRIFISSSKPDANE